MPSYNQARFVVEAVESCLRQDDPGWELWIVDNSTDDTPERLSAFKDPRIRFHHIPRRMSPGACLNWMLERCGGTFFSYIHTDNNLAPSFVREMSKALSRHPRALAYCDMRLMDEEGRATGLSRRFEFDLSNLLGSAGLGVPFAATLQVARDLGGFAEGDFADDVRFCSRAFGLGPWTHIRKPLVDYRQHGASRTEAIGLKGLAHALLESHFVSLVELEARGLDPLGAMAKRVERHLNEADLAVEDAWIKHIGPEPPRVNGSVAEAAWRQGLLKLSGFSSRGDGLGFPGHRRVLQYPKRRALQSARREMMRAHDEFVSVLTGWAWLTARKASVEVRKIQVGSADLGSLWCARLLQEAFGWQPVLQPGLEGVPEGISWPRSNVGDVWIGPDSVQAPPAGVVSLVLS